MNVKLIATITTNSCGQFDQKVWLKP